MIPSLDGCATPQLTREAQLSRSLKGFRDHEISLIEFILHPDQIASLIYGQTFQNSMRSAFVGGLLAATDQLKDGFLAFAKALSDNKNIKLGGSLAVTHAEDGSKALQRLRSFETGSLGDARTALGLALVLVTYNDLSVGAPTLPISRSALLQAMPWRQQLICSTTEDTDPNIICLLFVEVCECLVLGDLPIFRFEAPQKSTIVDRYYGICHELLPHLYDICHLYKSIKAGEVSDAERILFTDWIASSVAEWTPEVILSQRENIIVDEVEKHHFLLQARAFKSATQLLLLQAQRTPLTDMLARSKAAQLDSQVQEVIQQGANRPKYLLFPYFVACLELYEMNDKDVDEEILKTMNTISNGMAPKACQSMSACLKHIRRNKQRKPGLSWFECVDKGLLIAMGP